jgi:hypothetical protein
VAGAGSRLRVQEAAGRHRRLAGLRLATGLLRRLFEGKAVKDGIRAEAVVRAINAPTDKAAAYQMSSELLVRAPHRQAYEVSSGLYVKRSKWPMPGMTVPIVVDRNDDAHVQVLWDEVPDRTEPEMQEALTAELKAGRIRARHTIESDRNPDDPQALYELFDESQAEGKPDYVIELVGSAAN